MNKQKKIWLALALTVVLLAVTCIGAWYAPKGTLHLILRNMFSPTIAMPEEEWTKGNSYEYLPYSTMSDSDYLHLYVPDNVEKPPLLVLVHGGGFVYNDAHSRQAQFMYRYFRDHGYACASVNYRLADEAKYPAALEDVKASIKFLRYHAEEYGYDANRIAIWGESAGGYLATMIALAGEEDFNNVSFIGQETATQPVSAEVSVLLNYYGVMNFERKEADFQALGVPLWLSKLGWMGRSACEAWLGKTEKELTEEEITMLSPKTYMVGQKDLDVYVAHGDVDITVPVLQSERLKEDLSIYLGEEKVCLDVKKNYRHASDEFYSEENMRKVEAWLKERL